MAHICGNIDRQHTRQKKTPL